MAVTIFSWGYWGWGNATDQLVHGIDAAESERGHSPPIFVDIRIRRTGRAKGFVGDAFCKTLTWEGHVDRIRCPYLCVAGEAEGYRARGFKGMKMKVGRNPSTQTHLRELTGNKAFCEVDPEEDLARVAAVRQARGWLLYTSDAAGERTRGDICGWPVA